VLETPLMTPGVSFPCDPKRAPTASLVRDISRVPRGLDGLFAESSALLALAPMQDVTDLAFWRLVQAYGGADLYVTEYFRVYATSTPDKTVLRSITENPTGRPVLAQMIGHEIPALLRTARQLQRYPIGGIDLNLGCPAPVVCRKSAGGGLLGEPARVDAILGAWREVVTTKLTVKTRIGFDSPALFDDLLGIFARHRLDLVTVHGRTVAEMYRSDVHYDLIARAVRYLPCPVLANGNVSSPARALRILDETGARGLMIGRGAIRNPWLFAQIRQALRKEPVSLPTGREVLGYLDALFEATRSPGLTERAHVQRVKKYVTYVGLGIEPTGAFLHQVRRVTTAAEFRRVCLAFLDHDQPMALEPFPLPLKASDVLAGVH